MGDVFIFIQKMYAGVRLTREVAPMSTTAIATLVYLRDAQGRICLARKNGNIHKGGQELKKSKTAWNGYGGKQESDETILEAAIRELESESSVVGQEDDLELVGKMSFYWPGNTSTDPDMIVWCFFLLEFVGTPCAGIEMGEPIFFITDEIPYREMLPADQLFLPRFIAGEKLTWDVYLGERDKYGDVRYVDKKTVPTL